MRAMALAVNGENTASQFEAIEARWPEWPQASVARAFVLGSAGKSEPAARALDAAETTGDVSSAIYFCQALLALNSTAPELDDAKALTAKGLAMSPDNHAARAFAAYLTELTANRQRSADRRKTLLLAAELLFG
jgi:hypothetical protein